MWINFGNSLCSLAPEGVFSAARCSGGAPSAPSRSTPTASACRLPVSATGCCQPSPSGTTSRPLTACRGADSSTSYQADSPAKTSASQDAARESTGSAVACGGISRASFAKYNRDTSSWRTPQLSLLAGLDESSVTWPHSGTMRDGECSALMPLERHTNATACGSGQKWPTPCASEGQDCGSQWTALAKLDKGGRIQRRMATLGVRETQETQKAALNPAWVEWLMGWPVGWTDLKQSGTDKFQQWQQQHGVCSEVKNEPHDP